MRLEYNRKDKIIGNDMKECVQCGRYLSILYSDDLCPECKELNLFAAVKDYIRNNDVKEADVAAHFGISVSKVKNWIREGRIQYKHMDDAGLSGVKCQICGKKLDFGNVCPECRKLQDLQVVSRQYAQKRQEKMRFINHGQES